LHSASQVRHIRFVLFDAKSVRTYVREFEKLHAAGAVTPVNIERKSP